MQTEDEKAFLAMLKVRGTKTPIPVKPQVFHQVHLLLDTLEYVAHDMPFCWKQEEFDDGSTLRREMTACWVDVDKLQFWQLELGLPLTDMVPEDFYGVRTERDGLEIPFH